MTTSYNAYIRNRFIELSQRWSDMARREQLNITPYFDSELPHFSVLSEAEQNHVIWQLETLVNIGQRLQTQGLQVRSGKALTKAFLEHLGYNGPSDLFNVMSDMDVVDIYSTNHKLIFANLRFFEFMSYSLEDFYCRSWMELFRRRDHRVLEQIVKLTEDLLAGRIKGCFPTTIIPTHLCEETSSPKQLKFLVSSRFFAPLYSEGKVIAYLCANRGVALN